jgi:hypothetical protein
VSSSWRQRNPDREACQDGCAGIAARGPRCLGGICAAYSHRRGLELNCTARGAYNTKTFCDVLAKIFGGLLATPKGSCRADRDCGTYPAGPADCGGATDETTAVQLRQLGEAFRARRCDARSACAPRQARRALCRQGRCVSSP